MTTIRWNFTLVVGVIIALVNSVQAQPTAHYCPGSEGILSASLPPPGLYLRDYNVFYTASRLDNSSGHGTGPANFDVFTYAQVPRLIWISNTKFLGGDLGASILLPLLDTHVRAGGFDSTTFGAGDVYIDCLDAWHWKQFDLVFAPGMWFPTGDSAAPPTTRAGMGYYAGMFTIGGTWFIDKEKTWSVSTVNRYEINADQSETHITTGNAYTVDWGIGKQVLKRMNLGVSGYYQAKVTPDSGFGATHSPNSVVAVGPEIVATIPKIEVIASLRWLYEFTAQNRAQGQTIVLTLTKRF